MAEKEAIITYETLYEILRREKFRKELQPLDKSFFKNVTHYLNEKTSILNSQQKKSSIFSSIETQKTRRQLENIQRILKELYERRESKIIQLALFSSRTQQNKQTIVMLEEEKSLYDHILDTLNNHRKSILHSLLAAKTPDLKKTIQPKDLKTKTQEKSNTRLIRLLQEVPKFIGTDLNNYGPFEREDVANLPEKIANLLIKTKRAEKI